MNLQLTRQLILNRISFQGTFPCTAEQFFNNLLSDDSSYTTEYRTARKDKDINVSIQHNASTFGQESLSLVHIVRAFPRKNILTFPAVHG
jgi:hypothetical protein